MILSNLTIPLLGLVDTAVMGHMSEAHYLGAVAIGALIFSFIYWGFGFLRMGTGGLTAQAEGARDGAELRAVLGRALMIIMFMFIIIFVMVFIMLMFFVWFYIININFR